MSLPPRRTTRQNILFAAGGTAVSVCSATAPAAVSVVTDCQSTKFALRSSLYCAPASVDHFSSQLPPPTRTGDSENRGGACAHELRWGVVNVSKSSPNGIPNDLCKCRFRGFFMQAPIPFSLNRSKLKIPPLSPRVAPLGKPPPVVI